jgi:hypothetical protein
MKVELLCLNSANKPSPISKGVTEIRINNQPCMSINLTTRHTQARRTSRVATVHDAVKETIRTHLTLVHVFHAYASTDTLWVAHALFHYTFVRYGRIASVSAAHDTTQFGDSICPICVNTFQMLVHSDPTDVDLNRHRRGLPPWSTKFYIRLLSFLSIQYSPFSPNCPARSPIMSFYQLIKFSTFQSWTRVKKVLSLVSGICHSTSTRVLFTKHSTTNGFSTTIGARRYKKGIMHSKVSFNSYNINAQIK